HHRGAVLDYRRTLCGGRYRSVLCRMVVATVNDTQARIDALSSWHHDWSGLRVAVLGLGSTGFSVADTLVELGAIVHVVYGQPDSDRERLLDVIGAGRTLASTDDDHIAALEALRPDIVVVSPGYPAHHPVPAWAADRGITVW